MRSEPFIPKLGDHPMLTDAQNRFFRRAFAPANEALRRIWTELAPVMPPDELADEVLARLEHELDEASYSKLLAASALREEQLDHLARMSEQDG